MADLAVTRGIDDVLARGFADFVWQQVLSILTGARHSHA